MDALTLGVEIALPVASAVGSAAFVLWRAARMLQSIETMAKSAKELSEQNERELKVANEEANRQWQDIGYTLGRIEGAMTGQPGPMRRRNPSQGGG